MAIEADTSGENNSFVYVDLVVPGTDNGLDCARRFVVGDAYARFRRALGDSVLFAPAIATGGEEVEKEAAAQGIPPEDLADDFAAELRERCERLAVSCDWVQGVLTSSPGLLRRSQRIFLELFEQELLYRQKLSTDGDGGRPWYLRCEALAEWCDRDQDDLPGWAGSAIEAQREAVGRVEGVEIDASLLGGGRVPVFTPFPDAIGEAAFIAISPHHADLQAVASPSDLEQLGNDAGPVKMAQTAMQGAIPGIEDLLPIVVTPSVDARFGPTLSLGIPNRDDVDREIAVRLVKAAGLPFRTSGTNSKPRPTTRFRLPDLPVSRVGEWGAPIPIVHCGDCGPVAAEIDDTPASSSAAAQAEAGAAASACPKCGGPARRDRQVLGGEFERMWAWTTIPVPREERESSSLTRSFELDRWLPVRHAVWSAADTRRFLSERIAARVAGEIGPQQGENAAEPFAGATVCGPVAVDEDGVGGPRQLDELAGEVGPDAVRLTILHSASVDRATSWSQATLRHAQRFLAELRDYAEPRLRDSSEPQRLEIDRSSRPRRRLSAWCKTAEAKVSANLDQLQMHRATFDLMLFLKRIRDFEQRCLDDGELSRLDREAVVVALLRLLRLAAPFVPNAAAELTAIAGGETSPPLG